MQATCQRGYELFWFIMIRDDYDSLVESIFRRFPSVQTSTFGDAYKPGLEHIPDFDS